MTVIEDKIRHAVSGLKLRRTYGDVVLGEINETPMTMGI